MTKFPKVYDSPIELVGRTPLLRLGRLFPDATVLGKLEFFNPAGSVKDRTALSIVRAAEADGRLKPGGTILEATSGNTGIALAWIGASLGYKVIICMPDDVSHERRALLRALGVELVLTPGKDAMAGANQEAGRILERTPGAFLSGQGGNRRPGRRARLHGRHGRHDHGRRLVPAFEEPECADLCRRTC